MRYQCVVVGGGFYGCAIALHLKRLGFERIALIERESHLLTRASYGNQARVHNGYHYPRSYLTAYRSRLNLPRFRRDFGFAVKTDFVMLYAIAAKRSKVTSSQFEHFMRDIGAIYQIAGPEYISLFDATQVASVYVVEEYAFDALRLREYFVKEFVSANVEVMLNTESMGISTGSYSDGLSIQLRCCGGVRRIEADTVFNCTYSALNHTVRDGYKTTALKHEIAELALVEVPSQLSRLGITVMDGPFFSCMPFPAEECHSLSHVRYTPHTFFIDEEGSCDPSVRLDLRLLKSRARFMIADAARLTPCLRGARWRRSLFETKTVLARNEANDGRPILLRREPMHPNLFSVLGGKLDNVYDIFTRLESLLSDPTEGIHIKARL